MEFPSPNFTDLTNRRNIAGLRPFRKNTYRLDHEHIGDKLIIHNYGHGGAGITMSMGCAYEVEKLLKANIDNLNKVKIAIIGAGVMGLTVAKKLSEKKLNISIYAKDLVPNTTSNIAGGQWAPSIVKWKKDEKGITQFNTILRNSFRYFESKIGQGYGVSKRKNFTIRKSKSFEVVPRDLIPAPTFYPKLPFEGMTQNGYSYETLLIEPPIFLSKMMGELENSNVPINQMTFNSIDDLKELEETVIINCSGLGSKNLFNDQNVIPYKGNLVLIDPQPELKYLYSSNGYLFPRKDSIVIGGSVDLDFDPTPDTEKCNEILNNMIKIFDSEQDEIALNEFAKSNSWYFKD